MHPHIVIVIFICPLNALMDDQAKRFGDVGVSVGCIGSGMNPADKEGIMCKVTTSG